MKQYTLREFVTLLNKNGFYMHRHGKHPVYVNNQGKHISLPTSKRGKQLPCVIVRRLIKENNLKE